MIVKCSNCSSSFAVDDAKVNNKKFAFNCPKCSVENIIDNRLTKSSEIPAIDAIKGFEAEKKSAKQPDALSVSDASASDFDVDFAVFNEPDGEKRKSAVASAEEIDDSFDIPENNKENNFDLDSLIPDNQVKEPNKTKTEAQKDSGLDDFVFDFDDNLEKKPAEKSQAEADSNTEDDFTDINFDDFDNIDEGLSASPKDTEIKDELDHDHQVTDKGQNDDFSDDNINGMDPDLEITDDFGQDINLDDNVSVNDTGKPLERKNYSPDGVNDDDSITIDLDSLDIELDEDTASNVDEGDQDVNDLDIDFDALPATGSPLSEEDITLDLDSLDIDLEEEPGSETPALEAKTPNFKKTNKSGTDDSSETLDLGSLDISLVETEDYKNGENPEDEKLTIADAGLDIDELMRDEISTLSSSPDDFDDDIKLTIDEIDPSLNVNNIEDELKEAESILAESSDSDDRLLVDELENLPDIEFEDTSIVAAGAAGAGALAYAAGKSKDETKNRRIIDDSIDLFELDDDKILPKRMEKTDIIRGGAIGFSIDFSIRYSRIRAILRLLMLYAISMIPHFVVYFLYMILASILGFINQIVILIKGETEEDFTEIQENTLRYMLSISASLMGVIDERPVYAGRDNIDHALQLKITYPLRYSKLFAFLRLTGIGMFIICMPHILLLTLISLTFIIIYPAGLLSVIFTAKWPRILFDVMMLYYKYLSKVLAFMTGLIDVYPSFKLK